MGGSMRKSLIFVCVATILLAWQLRADQCGLELCLPVQATHAKCWAGCLEFLSCDYIYEYDQCDFGTYACWMNYMQCSPIPPYCDCYGEGDPCLDCTSNAGQVCDIMANAGFFLPHDPPLEVTLSEDSTVAIICREYPWRIMTLHFLYSGEELIAGHAMVILRYDDEDYVFKYMDPFYGDFRYATYEGLLIAHGSWMGTVVTNGFWPSPSFRNIVGIGDIESFSAYEEHLEPCHTRLEFSIVATADTNEQSAVYIADNALGPARLIQPLVGYPLLEPQTNAWIDLWRYCERGSYYYYFMDHSLNYPFPEVRKVALEELKPSSTNPYYSCGNCIYDRPVFDPPSQVTVSDIPLDAGNVLRIAWDVSAQDDTIDCYNIYRWATDDSNATMEGYVYLTSVLKGTPSYLDTTVQYFHYYSYKVSAAHHGYYQTIPYGNFGIWNDFSSPSEGGLIAPVNNFYDISLSFPSAQYDTLRMCPEGDLDTIRVFLTITGSDGSSTQNIPVSDISLIDISHNPSYFCNTDHLHPVAATNEMGFTEFRFPYAGGCGSMSFQAIIREHYASSSLSAAMR